MLIRRTGQNLVVGYRRRDRSREGELPGYVTGDGGFQLLDFRFIDTPSFDRLFV